jgi:hypothetical protein
MKDVGKCYGHLVYFTDISHILWPFVVIWYIFQFWYVVPRKIWQPCADGETELEDLKLRR